MADTRRVTQLGGEIFSTQEGDRVTQLGAEIFSTQEGARVTQLGVEIISNEGVAPSGRRNRAFIITM